MRHLCSVCCTFCAGSKRHLSEAASRVDGAWVQRCGTEHHQRAVQRCGGHVCLHPKWKAWPGSLLNSTSAASWCHPVLL